MKKLALILLVLGVALALIMTGCDSVAAPTPTPTPTATPTPNTTPTPTPTPTPIPNNPPLITKLTAYPSSVAPGGTSTITCIASDPDDDTITYTWSATGGTISGVGSIVTWIAPPVTGIFTISVTAADGVVGTDTESCYTAVSAITPTPTPGPITITDDLGRTVTIEEIPQRIVSLAPSNTEILFALDLGDKVVGVTDYCDYPEELSERIDSGEIQTVGAPWPGFSLETIVSLDPDVAFAIGETVPDYVDDLEGLGIPTVMLQPHDIAGIFRDIELVGEITGNDAEAEDLIDEMRAHLVAICTITASANTTPTVFYEVDGWDPTAPWTTGSGTFIDTLITLAAGENIASDAPGWYQMSLEAIVARDPEIIILGDCEWGVSPESVAAREGWQDITAVINEEIFCIDSNLLSRPGPRIFDGLEELAEIIHPELFE